MTFHTERHLPGCECSQCCYRAPVESRCSAARSGEQGDLVAGVQPAALIAKLEARIKDFDYGILSDEWDKGIIRGLEIAIEIIQHT